MRGTAWCCHLLSKFLYLCEWSHDSLYLLVTHIHVSMFLRGCYLFVTTHTHTALYTQSPSVRQASPLSSAQCKTLLFNNKNLIGPAPDALFAPYCNLIWSKTTDKGFPTDSRPATSPSISTVLHPLISNPHHSGELSAANQASPGGISTLVFCLTTLSFCTQEKYTGLHDLCPGA